MKKTKKENIVRGVHTGRQAVLVTAICIMGMLCAGCGRSKEQTTVDMDNASESDMVASSDDMATPQDIVDEDMVPVYGESIKDGIYPVTVDSSSSMFQITACELHVEQGRMTAAMTMGGTGYLYVYMGSGEEAVKASESDYIAFTENADGTHTFAVPVEALDMGIDCTAFSKKKEKWYDRVLVFRADSLPQSAFVEDMLTTAASLKLSDGTYTVAAELSGGSGRAYVESPAELTVKDGRAYATITWSSPNYDYMLVDDEKYMPINTEGNAVFEIPVSVFDRAIPVKASTSAMSTPHEIEYTLYFDSGTIISAAHSMKLDYAEQFAVDYSEDGYIWITIAGTERYLLVPEGLEAPQNLEEGIVVLQQPLSHMYLAATSAMDLIRATGGMASVSFSGTDADGWYIEEARQAMESGDIVYAGKYSAPDFERLLAGHCDIAVESTMILHTPEIREQLEAVGIPVLIEHSSYESHPLGRMEWVKLYGVLLGREAEAEAYFDSQVAAVKDILEQESMGKTVAFFYITPNGAVNVRKSGDYVSKMIALAGGEYIFSDLTDEEENSLSTMTIQMESFYEQARDADCLIYNSTVDGELHSMEELLAKSELLRDFKAVKNGNVWCTGKNMFQESTCIGAMISDIHTVLENESAEDSDLTYLHRIL